MSTDLARIPPTAAAGRKWTEGDRLAGLTRRASLNAIASLVDYSVKIGVGLIVTPILVSGLGRSMYGILEILSRLSLYIGMTDGRPTEALRLIVAQQQGIDDDEAKRRHVGAALLVWMIVLPFVITLGAVLTWLAPTLTKAPDAVHLEVRITCVLLMVTFLLRSLASIPESVLRGMNLGYRRMGFQAGLNVLGGVFAIAAIQMGYGLAGQGGARVALAIATAICFWLIVRGCVKWFAAARPRREEMRTFFAMSVWLTAGEVVTTILLSEVVVLGAVVGPAAVTIYVLTGYAARAASGIHIFGTDAAIPGLGGILGRRQYDRAGNARRELLVLTWLYVTVIGSVILLWNRSFLTLWVGEENYAGPMVDALIVLIAVQAAFIRVDAYIIDAALRPRVRVIVSAVAAVLTVGFTIALASLYGLIGLCVGVLGGRAIQSVAYPLVVRSSLGNRSRSTIERAGAVRFMAATGVLFTGAALAGQRMLADGWLTWLAGVFSSVAIVTVMALAIGPDASTRRTLIRRLRTIVERGVR